MAGQLSLTLPGENQTLQYQSNDLGAAACSIELQEDIRSDNQSGNYVFFGTRTTEDGNTSKVVVKASISAEGNAKLIAEVANYTKLAHLQGTVIPVNLGRFEHVSGTSRRYYHLPSLLVLESSDVWEPIGGIDYKLLPFTLRKNIIESAVALHRAGFFHEDGQFHGWHILRHRGDDSIRLVSLRDNDHENCPYIGQENLDILGFVPDEEKLCERLRETYWLTGICKPEHIGSNFNFALDTVDGSNFDLALDTVEDHAMQFFPRRVQGITDAIRAWREGGRTEEGKRALRHILPHDCVKDPVA
ncbi:hypothetical protein FA95DRAFT_1596817 [Auriscalpium vulgare]|uniref:Uncharacterized protein n=1 Tax=Auriscalpium vulgare TaxID=40419 RepID=A0ACB8RNK8_9AGAM|nr:hypothetical protein FA95DRAFT_1596817 [Auriscalpium vulgare]